MLCHRCSLGAKVWVNVFPFYYIGMVISISVLSFYSDGYYFSFYVVDIPVLQSFELAIITVVDSNNNNNNNTYIALIRMRSKRFTSIVLQYDLEI